MEIVIANESHFKYAQIICDTIAESAKVRGTGIAKRTPEYIMKRLQNGNAIIALDGDRIDGEVMLVEVEVESNDRIIEQHVVTL